MRLLRCWDVAADLKDEVTRQAQKYADGQNSKELPHVIGLEGKVENFLYEAKNFLRDLTAAINVPFGTNFKDASDFVIGGKHRILSWAIERFGQDHALTGLFGYHQGWITEVIRRRNAREHPKGKSGVVHIENFNTRNDGQLRAPVWSRNGKPASDVVNGLECIRGTLLEFAEELLALTIREKFHSEILEIYEIPEGDRNPQIPIRFSVRLTHAIAAKLAKQVERDNEQAG